MVISGLLHLYSAGALLSAGGSAGSRQDDAALAQYLAGVCVCVYVMRLRVHVYAHVCICVRVKFRV